MENNESSVKIPRKKSVFLLILFTIITLGIYPYIWYIKRVEEFNNLRTSTKAKKGIAIFSLILLIVLLLTNFTLNIYIALSSPQTASGFSEIPLEFLIFSGAILLLSILLAVTTLLMAFRYRKILNQTLENKQTFVKLSSLFTFFFHFLYLQYEINRIIQDKEEDKRIAPWICFILFIAIPIISSIILGLISLI
jgi:hypothetical protein